MDCQKRIEAAGTNCKVKRRQISDIRAMYEYNLVITGAIVIPNCSILRAKYRGLCEVDTYVGIHKTRNHVAHFPKYPETCHPAAGKRYANRLVILRQ
jgi:hypothetical protein